MSDTFIIQVDQPVFGFQQTDGPTFNIQSSGPPGPSGQDAEAWAPITRVNDDDDDTPIGSPLSGTVNGRWTRASATGDQKPCVAVAKEVGQSEQDLPGAPAGPIYSEDWTAVVGTQTLTAKNRYFLGTTPGTLVVTPNRTAGNILQLVGTALDEYTLVLQIGDPIRL